MDETSWQMVNFPSQTRSVKLSSLTLTPKSVRWSREHKRFILITQQAPFSRNLKGLYSLSFMNDFRIPN